MTEKTLKTQLHGAMGLGFTWALLLGALAWRVAPDYAAQIMITGILAFYAGSFIMARAAARAEFRTQKMDDAS